MIVYTVGGQSNAIGCGRPKPPQHDPSNYNLFQLAQVGPKTGQIVPLTEPMLGPGADGSEGVGPAAQLARKVRDHTGEWVLLIPCAYGGTGLYRDRWHPRRGDLYIRMVEETRKVLEEVSDVTFGGLIWVQGELDSVMKVLAADYRYHLDSLIQEFREDIHQLAAPVVIGSMVPSWINKGYNISGTAPQIHQVQAETPARWAFPKQPNRVAFAQGPDGPGQDSDGIHYTADQARTLGDTMFLRLLQMGVL